MKITKKELKSLNESLKKWIRLTEGKESGKTTKFVYNHGFGGFKISSKMEKWLKEHGATKAQLEWDYFDRCEKRCDPLLVQCVEECKPSHLSIVDIPNRAVKNLVLTDYDGAEWFEEKGHFWPAH